MTVEGTGEGTGEGTAGTSGSDQRPPFAPWRVALVYVAIAVALAAIGLGGLWGDLSVLPEPPSRWWTLATAVPAAGVVLLKGRAPWWGFGIAILIAAVDLATVGGLVPMLVVLELLHTGIVSLGAPQRRRVLRGIVAAAVAGAGAALILTGDPRATVLVGLQLGALLGMTYWYANSVAQSAELVELYRERAADLGRLAELDRDRAVRAERDRVARELHDVVAGHIAAVAIRSEAALSAGGAAVPGTPDADRAALRAVRDSSLAAHAALRDLIGVLRSDADRAAGAAQRNDAARAVRGALGRASLPGLCAEAERSGLQVTMSDSGAGALAPAAELVLGQVVRETLANAARHSAGGTVGVRVDAGTGPERQPGVRVEVVTRGGAPLAHPELRGSRMGLRMLDERVRACGGEFSAGPGASGWEVIAWLPTAGPPSARPPLAEEGNADDDR